MYGSTNGDDYYYNWWGGNLRGIGYYPANFGYFQDKLVYSPHDYGPTVYKQPWFYDGFNKTTLYQDCWYPNWYFIVDQGISPLLIGEWGGKTSADGKRFTDNETWLRALADFIADNEMHQTFWCFNPNSGDTGGILERDWVTVDQYKYDIVEPGLWQDTTGKYVGLDHELNLGSSRTGTTIDAYYSGGGDSPTPPPVPILQVYYVT